MRRRLLLVLALLVGLGVLAGCGVPGDARPRDIADADRGDLGGEDPAPAPGGGSGPKVYFLEDSGNGGSRLRSTSRNVLPSPGAVIGELLKGLTPGEQARKWRTAVPSGTQLRSASIDAQGLVTVDLSDAFFNATGDAQIKAVAQVVYTASALGNVSGVRILVDGRAREWPRGDGTLQSDPLTPLAYPDLNPSSQPEYPPEPAPEEVSPTAAPPTVPATSG